MILAFAEGSNRARSERP